MMRRVNVEEWESAAIADASAVRPSAEIPRVSAGRRVWPWCRLGARDQVAVSWAGVVARAASAAQVCRCRHVLWWWRQRWSGTGRTFNCVWWIVSCRSAERRYRLSSLETSSLHVLTTAGWRLCTGPWRTGGIRGLPLFPHYNRPIAFTCHNVQLHVKLVMYRSKKISKKANWSVFGKKMYLWKRETVGNIKVDSTQNRPTTTWNFYGIYMLFRHYFPLCWSMGS